MTIMATATAVFALIRWALLVVIVCLLLVVGQSTEREGGVAIRYVLLVTGPLLTLGVAVRTPRRRSAD